MPDVESSVVVSYPRFGKNAKGRVVQLPARLEYSVAAMSADWWKRFEAAAAKVREGGGEQALGH